MSDKKKFVKYVLLESAINATNSLFCLGLKYAYSKYANRNKQNVSIHHKLPKSGLIEFKL